MSKPARESDDQDEIRRHKLIARGARALARDGDGGSAYALFEAANNLRLVMRKDATIDDWKEVYVGEGGEAFDCDAEVDAACGR